MTMTTIPHPPPRPRHPRHPRRSPAPPARFALYPVAPSERLVDRPSDRRCRWMMSRDGDDARARAHRASATNLTSSSSTTEIHDGAPPFARARIVAIPRRRPRNHIAIGVVIHHHHRHHHHRRRHPCAHIVTIRSTATPSHAHTHTRTTRAGARAAVPIAIAIAFDDDTINHPVHEKHPRARISRARGTLAHRVDVFFMFIFIHRAHTAFARVRLRAMRRMRCDAMRCARPWASGRVVYGRSSNDRAHKPIE